MIKASDAPRKAILWVLFGLVALSCLYFLYRGPYRAWDGIDRRDLNVFYTASQAWVYGSNPYDSQNLHELFVRAGVNVAPDVSVNPPTTFVLLAPWAVLPWPIAVTVSIFLNVLLAAASTAMVMSLAHLRISEPRGLLFLAFAFALAPFQTSIAWGQLTIAATALVVASLWGMVHDRPVLSGVSIALAVALKPQMGLIFLLLLLVRGQLKTVTAAVAALGIIATVAAARLAIAGVDWLPTLASNLAQSTQGGVNDPTLPNAYTMINLQPLLHVILPGQSQITIDVLTFCVGGVAGMILLLALRRRDDREAQFLLYGGCSVLTLLMVYNRIYSATLLILPVAWAFAASRSPGLRTIAAVVIAAAAVFLVPGAAALGSVPFPPDLQWVSQTLWWRLALFHEVPALLIILAGLLVAVRYRGATMAGEPILRKSASGRQE